MSVIWISGLRRWVSIAAALSLALTATALFIALTAADIAGTTGRELSQRLQPATAASAVLLAEYQDEQIVLRNYVTSGQRIALQQYREVTAKIPGQQEKVAALVRGYPHMPGDLATASVAWRAWLARIAGPQLQASAQGDFARARVLQANISSTRPYTLAIRLPVAALQSQLASLQMRVTALLVSAEGRVFAALAAVCAVIAVIAVGGVVAVRRWLLVPFAALRAAAESVAAGHYDTAIPTVGPVELADLGRSAELMRARLADALADARRAEERLRGRSSQLEKSNNSLTERSRQLETSNEELEQYAYIASHDLQEPLRKMASFCQLLARRYQGQLDEQADQYIAYVVDGARRMQELINDLLTFSRVGHSTVPTVEIDCNQVLERVRIDLAATVEEGGASIIVTGTLPTVRGDWARLVQLFENLVGNGIKFHGQEPPRIEISAAPDDTGWRFAVADNGIGIEPQYADRIFALFQRLHSRAEYPGTGIGLAICKKIVDGYGGTLCFDSRLGEGTTFYWTMPREEVSP
jgi:signal transduction histidine kinase